MATPRKKKPSTSSGDVLRVNRAPVLTLWGAVVAERLGHDREAALTLGKAVAGLNAVAKGRRLGIYHEREEDAEKPRKPARTKASSVELLGREVPVVRTRAGLRALDRGKPGSPEGVERYLRAKLGESYPAVRDAMSELARSLSKRDLAERAFALYEKFRPTVPEGERGWGAKGKLDLARLRRASKVQG
jgi:hypothetical protein